MKIYISQPMNGLTKEEIEDKRRDVISQFEAFHDVAFIDSLLMDAPKTKPPLYYLGESIKLLSEADAVYFCKNWNKYNGCVIEHECATRYGKRCIYE